MYLKQQHLKKWINKVSNTTKNITSLSNVLFAAAMQMKKYFIHLRETFVLPVWFCFLCVCVWLLPFLSSIFTCSFQFSFLFCAFFAFFPFSEREKENRVSWMNSKWNWKRTSDHQIYAVSVKDPHLLNYLVDEFILPLKRENCMWINKVNEKFDWLARARVCARSSRG